MSASPSGMPNGQNGPSRGPPPIRRKPKPNPLVAQKKPKPRPQPSQVPNRNTESGPAYVKASASQGDDKRLSEFDKLRKRQGGWTDPRPPDAMQPREFPLVTTKRALMEGMRFHAMRFARGKGGAPDQDIDPGDQDDFTRPVSLHRRDPRQPPPGRAVKDDAPEAPPADDKEAELLAAVKAEKEERDAQRALDMALIAPTNREAAYKKPQHKKERQLQVWMPKVSAEAKKEQEIRYEEALPWHLEDADGKNVWVGTYVSALSEANVAFVITQTGFRMVPLEKFYRFMPKPSFQTLTSEEAQAIMEKKVPMARWAMRDLEKQQVKEEIKASRVALGGRTRVKQESATFKSAPRSEKVDNDDIDFDDDEFQDDDENVGLEPDNDDEAKDSRERIRRDQLGANFFGNLEEKEVEKEEADQMMEELRRKLEGKKIRKALTRRERHAEYQSDSDDGSSFMDSSEDEAKKDEGAEKKDDDAKAKDKVPSGAASKGSNTPSGKQKANDTSKKSKSLKRPGSPNLSESSGNESSRKRVKKKANTSRMGSRSTTPMPGQSFSGARGGAASDGEGTAGEMSDGGVNKKKIRLVGTGAKGTPIGSRAGSPVPSQGRLAPGSKTVSPVKGGPSTPRAGSPSENIDVSEIITAIRSVPEGISVGGLLRMFGNRVGSKASTQPGQMPRSEWLARLKQVASIPRDGTSKFLRLKSNLPNEVKDS